MLALVLCVFGFLSGESRVLKGVSADLGAYDNGTVGTGILQFCHFMDFR